MTERRCPLCAGESVAVAELSAADLTYAYRSTGITVADELAGVGTTWLRRCRACGLGFFDPAAEGSAAFYDRLQALDWYYRDDKPEFAAVAAHLTGCSSVLDVGSGDGRFSHYLRSDTSYTGLDRSAKAAAAAERAGIDVRAEQIREHLASGSRYGAVVAFQVLEHTSDPRRLLEDMIAAAEPGGLIAVSVPGDDGFMGDLTGNPWNLPPHHLSRWPDKSLHTVASLLDLDVVAVVHDQLGSNHRSDFVRAVMLRMLGIGGRDVPVLGSAAAQRAARAVRPVAAVVGRAAWPFLRRCRGHSTTAIYRR